MTSVETDVWEDDLLGRKQDAEFLYNFLIGQVKKRKSQGRIGSYVINIDSDWGGGKTFFLERFAKDIAGRGHLVVKINAWRDDYAEDPYVAIMAAIDGAFAPYTKKDTRVKTAWNSAKKSGGAIAVRVGGAILKGLAKKTIGLDIDEVSDAFSEGIGGGELVSEAIESGVEEGAVQIEKFFDASLDIMVDGFNRTSAAMVDFRKKLEVAVEAITEEKTAPTFILVDELDRCRPTYAVQLLERVKHLFDVPGVVFVFGTNTAQLQHSIAGTYGANFDGFRYLKRFFDRTYAFEEPSLEAYVESLCKYFPEGKIRSPGDNLPKVLTLGFKAHGFDLRAISQIMEMIDATATAWPHRLPTDISLLFPLSIHFFNTGRAEWPSPAQLKGAPWVYPGSSYYDYEGRYINKDVNLNQVYEEAIGVFESIENIKKYHERRNDGPKAEYIRDIFLGEWNGVHLSSDKPSIQTELLGLVANAGRLRRETELD